MLPHEDNVLNKFRIWKERHIQMRENRSSHLVGWTTHPTILPRPGIELTTSRSPQRQHDQGVLCPNHSATAAMWLTAPIASSGRMCRVVRLLAVDGNANLSKLARTTRASINWLGAIAFSHLAAPTVVHATILYSGQSECCGSDADDCFEEASSSASSEANPDSAWDIAARIGLGNELGW